MSENRLQSIRVLLIEDEAMIAMLLEDVLEELGCNVVGTGSSLASAVELATTLDFDVALLDVNLRGERSDPVRVILRQRGIPFVLSTGYAESGADGNVRGEPRLQKPFDIDQLAAALVSALGPMQNT